MPESKLKIALIGCGQIADAHLQEIGKIPCAQAVAVCDQHPDLARQAAERFDVPRQFTDLARMLSDARPDALHITTPPQTHALMGVQALEAGVHVYIEKPFAIDLTDADCLLAAARTAGRLVCVGHDQLFDPIWTEVRSQRRAGRFGRIVHVDSVQGYDLGGPFGKAFASEPDHWVHRLPGGLFQNVMSHALYRVTEFLTDEEPRVWAKWFGDAADGGSPTELRVMLRGAEVSASLLFTAAARPVQRITRIYGTRASVEVDLDGRTIRSYRTPRLPGALAKIEAPFRHLRESAHTLSRSVWKFLRGDIHYFAGMSSLLRAFYESILTGGEPPISYAEIRRVTAIMDEIFQQCRAAEEPDESPLPPRVLI